jgi:hypothetical protein
MQDQSGGWSWRRVRGLGWVVRCRIQVGTFLILLGKQLVIEHRFE